MLYNGVRNNEFFANLKAQAWWHVADRFRNTYNHVTKGDKFKASELIGIDENCSHLERLVVELSTPKRDFDKAGRVKVESKDDLSARGIDSPNLADAFIMGANKGLIGSSVIKAVTVKGF
jgi:phage terminase large subunit